MLIESSFKKIFEPKKQKPLQLAVFGSGTGTVAEALIKEQKKNPHLFEIALLFTDRLCRFMEISNYYRIPLIHHEVRDKTTYDDEIGDLLEQTEIDLILLSGYMRIVKRPLLQRYRDKIINVHPADLSIKDLLGKRKYTGAHAVFDALRGGVKKTRSCVHLIDEGVDTGTVLVSGPWVNYEEGYPLTEERARMHQEKQKMQSDFPACASAIKLIAEGRVALMGNVVFVDEMAQETCGYEV